MDSHKKPRHGGNVPGSLSGLSISVRNSNMLATVAAVVLFAALGAAMGQAVDGMAADLTAGPVDIQGGRAHGE